MMALTPQKPGTGPGNRGGANDFPWVLKGARFIKYPKRHQGPAGGPSGQQGLPSDKSKAAPFRLGEDRQLEIRSGKAVSNEMVRGAESLAGPGGRATRTEPAKLNWSRNPLSLLELCPSIRT